MVTIDAKAPKVDLGTKLWAIGWWTLIALAFVWAVSGLVTGIIGWWAN
jgi:hypothetical protein